MTVIPRGAQSMRTERVGTFHMVCFWSHSYRRKVSRGFILPLTLWIVATIGVVVVAVNEWISRTIENSQLLRGRADGELAYSSIRDELIFLLATRPVTYRGMEVGQLIDRVDTPDLNALMMADYKTNRFIRMDGSPYLVESQPDYSIRIYDGRGLINLNTPSQPYLRRLLGLFKLPEQVRNGLIDSLEDYTDRDDLTRMSGAETKDYARLDRLPPTNALLIAPLEAQSVVGWDQVTSLWKRDRESPLLTTCRSFGFNPNTASREVLIATLVGLEEQEVTQVLEHRADLPFRNTRELSAVSGTVLREEPFFFTFAPGPCVIVELIHRPTGDRTRFSLTMEGFNAKSRPWQIDYVLRIPPKAPSTAGKSDSEEVFPAPNSMDADLQAIPETGGARSRSDLDFKSTNDAPSNL